MNSDLDVTTSVMTSGVAITAGAVGLSQLLYWVSPNALSAR
jgi:hypothetical protein